MSEDPLAALRRRFCERSLEDAAGLRAAAGLGDPGHAEAEQIIHRLAGAAALFGFEALGAEAAALDRRYAEGRPPDWPEVIALADRIERDLNVRLPDP